MCPKRRPSHLAEKDLIQASKTLDSMREERELVIGDRVVQNNSGCYAYKDGKYFFVPKELRKLGDREFIVIEFGQYEPRDMRGRNYEQYSNYIIEKHKNNLDLQKLFIGSEANFNNQIGHSPAEIVIYDPITDTKIFTRRMYVNNLNGLSYEQKKKLKTSIKSKANIFGHLLYQAFGPIDDGDEFLDREI